MNAVVVDKRQLDREVKERNKFYRTLVQIQIIAEKEDTGTNLQLRAIAEICHESLKNHQNRRRKESCF